MLIGTVAPRSLSRRSVSRRRNAPSIFDECWRGLPAARVNEAGGFVPRVDVDETDEALLFVAELPGVEEGDFEVVVDAEVVTIKGEKKLARPEQPTGISRVERASGEFSRSFRLPFDVEADSVSATYRNGVLSVTVPKPAVAEPHSVPITAD